MEAVAFIDFLLLVELTIETVLNFHILFSFLLREAQENYKNAPGRTT